MRISEEEPLFLRYSEQFFMLGALGTGSWFNDEGKLKRTGSPPLLEVQLMAVKLKRYTELGERKIVKIIQHHLDLMPKMPIPFGDDVSAYEIGNNEVAVLKTDMLVDKTDVPPGMSLRQAARKAVVMNVSDFAAKGVKPSVALVALGLPRNLKQRDIEELAEGLNAGAREYDCYVVGGDTGEASDLIVSVSMFGLARKDELVLRSGARPGDIVAVTGLFGKTSAGLKILANDFSVPPSLRGVLVRPVLTPQARLKEGLALSRAHSVSASMDSSDGLAWSLHELGRASKVGFLIDALPLAEEARRFAQLHGLDPVELALYGGEEYELVLTIRPERWNTAQRAINEVGGVLLPIGKATEKEGFILSKEGKKCVIEARGYEHFRSDHFC
jgi:thiamine-monophosphate kinase